MQTTQISLLSAIKYIFCYFIVAVHVSADIELNNVRNISESTSKWNLFGVPGDGYYVAAHIGTPPQNVNLLVDTGSSNLAVASSQNELVANYFASNDSLSFASFPNSHVKVAYTQGWWEGSLGSDIVSVPSLLNVSETRTDVALINQSHKFYVPGSNWQGILGLAFPELSRPNRTVQPWFDSLLATRNNSQSDSNFEHDEGINDESLETNDGLNDETNPVQSAKLYSNRAISPVSDEKAQAVVNIDRSNVDYSAVEVDRLRDVDSRNRILSSTDRTFSLETIDADSTNFVEYTTAKSANLSRSSLDFRENKLNPSSSTSNASLTYNEVDKSTSSHNLNLKSNVTSHNLNVKDSSHSDFLKAPKDLEDNPPLQSTMQNNLVNQTHSNSRISRKTNIRNSFGLELCGPWDFPYRNNHVGRIMLGDDAMDCGEGMWFEAPILQPWYYEIAVVGIAVNDELLSLPCTLYNTHASIVDSGTTELMLPPKVFDTVVKELLRATEGKWMFTEQFWRGEDEVCWEDDYEAWSYMPTISIEIALSNSSSFNLRIGPHSYLRPSMIQLDQSERHQNIKESMLDERLAGVQNYSTDALNEADEIPMSDGLDGEATLSSSTTVQKTLNKIPCWSSGIELSNMGTVLGVVALEGLCTRFDRGKGVLGFRQSVCGPPVQLAGPHRHYGAGSCVIGGGRSDVSTAILVVLLALLCCPLIVWSSRWIYLRFKPSNTHASPFMTFEEGQNNVLLS